MEYIALIEFFLAIAEGFVGKMENKLPAEVLGSIQAGLAALASHRDDLVTKANLEAQRG